MLEYSKLCENDDEENKYLNMDAEAENTEERLAISTKKYRINNNNEEEEFAPALQLLNNAQDILAEEDSRDEEITEEIVARGIIFEELAGCNDIDIKQQTKKLYQHSLDKLQRKRSHSSNSHQTSEILKAPINSRFTT